MNRVSPRDLRSRKFRRSPRPKSTAWAFRWTAGSLDLAGPPDLAKRSKPSSTIAAPSPNGRQASTFKFVQHRDSSSGLPAEGRAATQQAGDRPQRGVKPSSPGNALSGEEPGHLSLGIAKCRGCGRAASHATLLPTDLGEILLAVHWASCSHMCDPACRAPRQPRRHLCECFSEPVLQDRG